MTHEEYAEKAVPRVLEWLPASTPVMITARLNQVAAGRAAEVKRVAEIFRQAIAEPHDAEPSRCPVMLPNQYGNERCGRERGHKEKCCYDRGD